MGDILGSALISFLSFAFLLSYLDPQTRRRMAGQYRMHIDILVHGTILWIFLGTSTHGLIQAEAAGLCFSLYLRAYAHFKGYEKKDNGVWIRYAGTMT